MIQKCNSLLIVHKQNLFFILSFLFLICNICTKNIVLRQDLQYFTDKMQSSATNKKALPAYWKGYVTGVEGIEPSSGVLETLILPMNYTPTVFCFITKLT